MNSKFAPIVLFVYNRPKHTLQTLESLSTNELADKSELFIYADGPKKNATESDLQKIKETREIIKKNNWCAKVHIVESSENNGLAASIVKGVTEIVNRFGKIIVLEDDLLLSKCFLKFMNDGLTVYNEVDNVYSINGYMFPIEDNRNETVLLPYISTWGWATWKEKWDGLYIDNVNKEILSSNKFIKSRFNLADYDYLSMLKTKQNSWGILWYYKIFIKNGLNVYPTKSLVQNVGFDGSGENCGIEEKITNFNNEIHIVLSKTDIIDLFFYDKFLNYFTNDKKNKKFFSKLNSLIRLK